MGLILASSDFCESKIMYFGGIIFVNGMGNFMVFREYVLVFANS